MKAVLCKSLDGFEALEIADIAIPEPDAGEVRVRVTAVGVNFADTLITRGRYQFKPELPFSPGAELAGVIDAVGAGVADWRVGQRVMAYVNWGAAQEFVTIDADKLVDVPDAIDDLTAAGLSVTFGTAMHGLVDRGRCQPGERVAITGAAGGAGVAAVEVARRLGAEVIAITSSEAKADVARRAGAQHSVIFPPGDLKQRLRDVSNGDGVDIVYDCIGGDAAEPMVRALAWEGRFLVVGFAAGDIPRIPLNLLLLRGADIAGVFWGEFVRRHPRRHAANMQQVMTWLRDGSLAPRQHEVFDITQYKVALGRIANREATGKVIVTL